MQGDHINKIVKEIIARTNDSLLMQKAISLHSMRHSIAMHLLDNGADMEFIQSFLGHEEIDTSHIYARKNKQKQNKLRR
jgi:integrase/recombinase XerD